MQQEAFEEFPDPRTHTYMAYVELLRGKTKKLQRSIQNQKGGFTLPLSATMRVRVGGGALASFPRCQLLLSILLMCMASLTGVDSMTLDVEEGGEGCVIIKAEKGDTINGNFEVCCSVLLLYDSRGLYFPYNATIAIQLTCAPLLFWARMWNGTHEGSIV